MFIAQQFPGATNLEVVGGKRESRAEGLKRVDRLEPLDGVGCHSGLGRRKQVCIGTMVGSTDPAAQLMQLRETEAVGTVDNDRVGSGDVDTALDDRRAQQDVELAVIEIEHDLLEVALRHLSVSDAQIGLGHEFRELLLDTANLLHTIVNEIHLATTLDFAQTGFANDDVVPLADEGLDGESFGGWRRNERHVTNSAQCHVHRSRYWCRGKRQNIDLASQRADGFLVTYAEAVFLVHDNEANVLELLRMLQQTVRADYDIHATRSHACDDIADLFRCLEA